MKKEKLPEVEPVRLPVLFGMRPGKYILILLIAAVILIFFLLGILPGIVRGGRYISFETSYSDVGVILDGQYIGSSEGSRIFVSSGSHEAEYIKNIGLDCKPFIHCTNEPEEEKHEDALPSS